MSATLPHIVRRSMLAVFAPLALAACEPSWKGSAPVTRAAVQGDCGASVTVYPGDTVYGVSRRCNVSVRDLIEANRLEAPYVLQPGQVLRLPGGSGEYVVKKGDTLLVIARRHKVEFTSLAQFNDKRPPYTIYVGEKLRIPGSFSTSATATASAESPSPASGGLVIASPNAGGAKGGRATARPTRRDLPPSRDPQLAQQAPSPPPAVASQSSAPEPEMRHPAFQPQQVIPPPPPPVSGKGFVWPVRGEVVAEFGPVAKGQHNDGINIAAAKGTPIRAAENGVVAYAGNELKGFGNLLLIKHADGWMTAYAHADELNVRKGDTVRKGQQIATVGSTGSVSSPQLHFELRRGTEAVNPLDYLKGEPPVS